MKLTITAQFQDFLTQQGCDLPHWLAMAQISYHLQGEVLTITPLEYYRLMAAIDENITDEQLLAISDVSQVQLFLPPMFAALSASDGLIGLQRFAKFKQLIGPVTAEVQRLDQTVSVHFDFIYPQQQQTRFALLIEQYFVVSLLRTGSGQRIQPLLTAGPYDYGALGANFLGGTQQQSSRNQLIFALADLQQPFLTENNVMWSFMAPTLKERLAEVTTATTFAGTVQKALFAAIPAGKFSLDDLALEMGMSSRSIQRNLTAEQTSFKEQVQTVQRLLAINYLALGNVTPSEIAYLVGYNTPSSFSRAFKQWTGQTVSAYRQSLE